MIKLYFPSIKVTRASCPGGVAAARLYASAFKKLLLLSFLLPLGLEASMAATRPTIEDVNPHVFMQTTDTLKSTDETLEIKGHNFYITDPFRGGPTTVYLRQGTTGFVQLDNPIIGNTEGPEQTITVHFPSNKFLTRVQDLEIMVVVGIHPSFPYTINVLPAPSRQADVVSIEPSSFLPPDELPKGTKPEDYYKFRVKIANPDEEHNTTLYIANQPAPIEGYNLETGVIEATLPPAVRNYNDPIPIQVSTRKGMSIARYIRIVPVAP